MQNAVASFLSLYEFSAAGDDQLELIPNYFKQGYTNLEMLEFLKLHGGTVSLLTVKRRLRTLGLSRRPANIPRDELKEAIERERERESLVLVAALLATVGFGPGSEGKDVL